MTDLWAVWIALGRNATFLLVAVFLGKEILTQWLDQDLERFKTSLDKDTECF
jgi:hypothetical protein